MDALHAEQRRWRLRIATAAVLLDVANCVAFALLAIALFLRV
jgi:hypothetical protein